MHIYQQLNLKNKLSKQEAQRQNHGYRVFDGCQMGGGCREMGEEVRALRSTNRQLQTSHGDVKYSTGNGEAKELVRMTHGHEQWWTGCPRKQGVLGGGGQKGKKSRQLQERN